MVQYRKKLALGALGLVVLTPTAAFSHSGYHFTGAATSALTYGVQATIEVTDPATPSGLPDFFDASVMMADNVDDFIQDGWAEVGSELGSNGYPEQWLFEFDTYLGEWQYIESLTVGTSITVRVLPRSDCTSSSTSCWWGTQVFDPIHGIWRNLRWVPMPFGKAAYAYEFGEVHNGYSGQHFAIDANSNAVNWTASQLNYSSGWGPWSVNTNTYRYNGVPYCTAWSTYYTNFVNYKALFGFCP